MEEQAREPMAQPEPCQQRGAEGGFLNRARLRAILGSGQLRPVRAEDAARVAAVFNETALDGVSSATDTVWSAATAADYIELCNNSGWPMWVADTGQGIAAWVSIRAFSWMPGVCRETGEVAMYIGRRWYGSGLATHLFQLLAVLAVAHRYRSILAWVLESNASSCRFSRAMGGALRASLPDVARVGGRRVGVRIYAWDVDSLENSRLGRRMARRMGLPVQLPGENTSRGACPPVREGVTQ